MAFSTAKKEEGGNIVQWVAVGATLLAVIAALFKEEFVRILRHPSLDVAAIEPPHCHKLPVSYVVQRTAPTYVTTRGYFFRLWVQNNGNSKADQVQVFASKLWRQAADGGFREDLTFLPMNLLWSHYPEESRVVYADGISPEMGKHCDLGFIFKPTERIELGHDLPDVPSESTIFSLALEVKPSSNSHLLGPGVYRLELRIAAANCPPITRVLEINHTGKYYGNSDEMFRSGIGFKFIES